MLKIDASKLIQQVSSPEKQPTHFIILADNPIFQRVIEDKLERQFQTKAKLFMGKSSLEDYVNYLATCGMFEIAKPSLIELPEKLTAKLWNEIKKSFLRIPLPLEVSAYFFAPTSAKNVLKETDFTKGTSFYLCYEPNDVDLSKCAQALLLRYANLSKKSKPEQEELVRHSLESYSGDLVSCDMHFARMEKGNLSFSAALAGNPEINGFHVAEALALRDKHLIELRMTQSANCGQEASSVFMAIVYFLKQAAFVLMALEETKNLKLAFERAKIPYPAQARLQKALVFLNAEKINSFFTSAAKIEMEMRLQKNPHQYLSIELLNWLES
ncbi:MAG: hypothetical protein V4591_09925 [Bdellovibrionota bacterium]